MFVGFGEKPIDPRDGKPGNMTARSSMSEKERKRRMAEAPAEAAKPRNDLLKRSGKSTYSTAMTGRGLGILDWVPFTPTVARKWAWEPPDEPMGDGRLDSTLAGELTSIEMAFLRWGHTAPKWMVKAELKSRALFQNKKRKKKKKKKKKIVEEEHEDVIPMVPIPESVAGMLLQTVNEATASYTGGVRSRIEYQRRIQQMEGPGPLERACLDYFVVPVALVLIQFYLHVSAYWRVNEGFSRKKIKREDDDGEEETVKVAT